jgi:hypothetical protein
MAHAGANQGRLSERETYCRSREESCSFITIASPSLKRGEAAGRRANAPRHHLWEKLDQARRTLVGIR